MTQSQNFKFVQTQEGGKKDGASLMSNIIFSSSSSFHFHWDLSLSQTALTISGISMAPVKGKWGSKRAVEKHKSPEVTRR